MKHLFALLGLLSVLFFQPASAEEWDTIVTGPITVKNRARAGTPIKEVWAEGEIAAPVADIQQALTTPERFRSFMPNLKQSRQVLKPEGDGSVYVYTELDLPMVQSRDYVVRVWLDESVKPDGTGVFRQHWVATPDKLPERHNLIRVKVNDGSWLIKPAGDGARSWASYKFAVDPGGWVPAFAADMGNKQAVTETFHAVEKEAQRLSKERLKTRGAAPAVPAAAAAPGKADAGK